MHETTIWIDLDNSPHVPFFAPIVDELHRLGFVTLITARDCFQVRELADLFHLNYTLIGRHQGKNMLRKVAGLGCRAVQLMPTVLKHKPDLAVSHCSRSQLVASSCLAIPCMFIGDYEFATSWAVVEPTWMLCPEVIPDAAIRCNPARILRYPGIKEDVYVPRFRPDAGLREQLGLRDEDLVITMRPPAGEAHYHNPQSDELFDATVEFLSGHPDVKLVAVPRNAKQGAQLRERWAHLFAIGTMRIPEHVVDGLNLIWYSDLVVSGGGTMNREAAALGVPVYSVFRGQIGSVDRHLSAAGRLVLLENAEDVRRRIVVARRQRNAGLQHAGSAALEAIVRHIAISARACTAIPGRKAAA
jgi:predicted glycosyltransferase